MDQAPGVIIGAVSGSLATLFLLLIVGADYEGGYRDGQIDAINDKVKYHLVDQPDKTRKWELIEEASK